MKRRGPLLVRDSRRPPASTRLPAVQDAPVSCVRGYCV
jgi:hypothetical protein